MFSLFNKMFVNFFRPVVSSVVEKDGSQILTAPHPQGKFLYLFLQVTFQNNTSVKQYWIHFRSCLSLDFACKFYRAKWRCLQVKNINFYPNISPRAQWYANLLDTCFNQAAQNSSRARVQPKDQLAAGDCWWSLYPQGGKLDWNLSVSTNLASNLRSENLSLCHGIPLNKIFHLK